jgi:hypothetical protein
MGYSRTIRARVSASRRCGWNRTGNCVSGGTPADAKVARSMSTTTVVRSYLAGAFPNGVRDFQLPSTDDFDFAVRLEDGSERFFRVSYEEATETEDLRGDLELWKVADELRQVPPNEQIVLTTTGVRSQPRRF